MIGENSIVNEEKILDKIYSDMSLKKNYSFMIINKSKRYRDRVKIVEPSGFVTDIIINNEIN